MCEEIVVHEIQAGAITVECPECHEFIDCSSNPKGTNLICPACGTEFKVSGFAEIILD